MAFFDFGASARTLPNGRMATSSEQRMRFTKRLSFAWRLCSELAAVAEISLWPASVAGAPSLASYIWYPPNASLLSWDTIITLRRSVLGEVGQQPVNIPCTISVEHRVNDVSNLGHAPFLSLADKLVARSLLR